jgi:hypothetical protein
LSVTSTTLETQLPQPAWYGIEHNLLEICPVVQVTCRDGEAMFDYHNNIFFLGEGVVYVFMSNSFCDSSA